MVVRACSCGEFFDVNEKSKRILCKECSRSQPAKRKLRDIVQPDDPSDYTPRYNGIKYFDEE